MSRLLSIMNVLLVVSAVLAAWGALGLAEYAFPQLAFGLQNPDFPAGMQFLHFFSILVSGVVFLAGYVVRWAATPFVTVTLYAVLATLCFVETVDFGAFGGGPTRFVPMLIEYAVYVALGIYLLTSPAARRRFPRD
jgi:hypothetical protein